MEFSTGIVALVDAAGGEVDDAVAMWKVRAAREAAWTNAEVLWALRAAPALRDAFFSRLDASPGLRVAVSCSRQHALTGHARSSALQDTRVTAVAPDGTRPSHDRCHAARG